MRVNLSSSVGLVYVDFGTLGERRVERVRGDRGWQDGGGRQDGGEEEGVKEGRSEGEKGGGWGREGGRKRWTGYERG